MAEFGRVKARSCGAMDDKEMSAIGQSDADSEHRKSLFSLSIGIIDLPYPVDEVHVPHFEPLPLN
ncbi:hypothetical protein [Sphingomonas bacterium]|uniref:hypothetical protein n=1 Tax=Sphingomonas bacterium TaxID=1895847 RepID=UPI001C2DC787|nr:hypothetical protein [Sphingomonas bacterium]